MHKNDIIALITRIAGFSTLAADANFSANVNMVFGEYGPKIVAVLGLVTLVASDVIRYLSNPTTAATIAVTTKEVPNAQ